MGRALRPSISRWGKRQVRKHAELFQARRRVPHFIRISHRPTAGPLDGWTREAKGECCKGGIIVNVFQSVCQEAVVEHQNYYRIVMVKCYCNIIVVARLRRLNICVLQNALT